MKWIAFLLTVALASCTGTPVVPDSGASTCIVDVSNVDDGCTLAP
jgi:hypothetical protein